MELKECCSSNLKLSGICLVLYELRNIEQFSGTDASIEIFKDVIRVLKERPHIQTRRQGFRAHGMLDILNRLLPGVVF